MLDKSERKWLKTWLKEKVRTALIKCRIYEDDLDWMTNTIVQTIMESDNNEKVGGTDD